MIALRSSRIWKISKLGVGLMGGRGGWRLVCKL